MNKRHVSSEEKKAKDLKGKVIKMARSSNMNMDQFIQEVINTGEVCLSELACISTILNTCFRVTVCDKVRFPLNKVLRMDETINIYIYIHAQFILSHI